jgi:AraC-like DNA-binding protein
MQPGLQIRHATDGESTWESATMPVPLSLRPLVRLWIGISETSTGRCRRREIPGPHVILVFQFGPHIRISKCGSEECSFRYHSGLVAGLYDSFVTTEHDGFEASIQVNLTPLGARALLGLPLSEISRTVVELSDVLPNVRGLSDRLATTTSWLERFRIVENILIERLSLDAHLRPEIVWATQEVEASRRPWKMGDLARALQISRKHFDVLFRDHVGMLPKRYASLVRFERLTTRLSASPARHWADLALECGFADQAHMAREVRRFSGLSPTGLRAYVANMARLCPLDGHPQLDVLEWGDASDAQPAPSGSGSVVKAVR